MPTITTGRKSVTLYIDDNCITIMNCFANNQNPNWKDEDVFTILIEDARSYISAYMVHRKDLKGWIPEDSVSKVLAELD